MGAKARAHFGDPPDLRARIVEEWLARRQGVQKDRAFSRRPKPASFLIPHAPGQCLSAQASSGTLARLPHKDEPLCQKDAHILQESWRGLSRASKMFKSSKLYAPLSLHRPLSPASPTTPPPPPVFLKGRLPMPPVTPDSGK